MFLIYLPEIAFVVMAIYVLARAIRFGEERPTLTNATVIVGIVAAAVSILTAIFNFSGNFIDFFLSVFCLIFTLLLKFIVRFFVNDFDKKHQISVNTDEELYRFEFEQENPDDYLDENSRFNGEFKNFDDIDN